MISMVTRANSLRTKYWTRGIYSRVWVQGMKSEVVLLRHHFTPNVGGPYPRKILF